jgi:hypothetical protein
MVYQMIVNDVIETQKLYIHYLELGEQKLEYEILELE